jgi:crossover junction endodeoxyribonuclease RuvC
VGVFIGIDPGKKGGIALIKDDGRLLATLVMPDNVGDIRKWLEQWWDPSRWEIIRAYLEKAQVMFKDGQRQGVSAAFNYGTGYGKLLGMLETMGFSHELVRPQQWQKVMIPGSKKGQSKKDALIKARQLFPQETFIQKGCRVPHDGIIDAVLIAEYGRRQHVGR